MMTPVSSSFTEPRLAKLFSADKTLKDTPESTESSLHHVDLTAETIVPSETASIHSFASDDTAIEPADPENTMLDKSSASMGKGKNKGNKAQGKQTNPPQAAGHPARDAQVAEVTTEATESGQMSPSGDAGHELDNTTPTVDLDDATQSNTNEDQPEVSSTVESPFHPNQDPPKSPTANRGARDVSLEPHQKAEEQANGHINAPGGGEAITITTDDVHEEPHHNGHAHSPSSATTVVGDGFAYSGWGSPIEFEYDPDGILRDLDGILQLEAKLAEPQRKREALVAKANEKIVKGALDKLEATAVKSLREDIAAQARHHQDAMNEIEILLKHFEVNGVVQQLRKQVEVEVDRQIQSVVKQQVAEYLKEVSKAQSQAPAIDKIEKELLARKRDLHNIESRRLNKCIDPTHKEKHVHTMLMANGHVSKHFPKTCGDLQKLTQSASRELLNDYGIQSPTLKREENINRFLIFCGIDYILGSQPVGY